MLKTELEQNAVLETIQRLLSRPQAASGALVALLRLRFVTDAIAA
jgi:hypothetical protein